MKKFVTNLKDSALELKRLRVLTACAMLAALAAALNYVAWQPSDGIKIGFDTLPNQIVDWLFGPVTGAIFAAVADVVKFFTKPTGYDFFFGYTFSAMLAAVIYGISYYKRSLTLWRILVTKAIVTVVVNMFLNTLWVAMTTVVWDFTPGGLDALFAQFVVRFSFRVGPQVVMWIINSAIYYVLVSGLEKTGVLKLFRKDK